MNSRLQLKRQQVISLVLVILALALSATPALAWFDEGGDNFQSSRTMTCSVTNSVTSNSAGSYEMLEHPLGLLKAESW